MVAAASRAMMAMHSFGNVARANPDLFWTSGQSRWAAFCRSSHAAISSGDRPACCMAVTWLVLVLLTADGPILVRAALRTRHGGAIDAFDFSGAMAQRAGIGWYGHVCSFSSVDTGRLRAALQLELYQIFSDMVRWSSGDARAVTIRVSALPSLRA